MGGLSHGQPSIYVCSKEARKGSQSKTPLPGDGGGPGMGLSAGCLPSHHPLVLMVSALFCSPPPQPATATSMLGAADSTWSSTSYRGARAGVSVSTAATTLPAATATTARRASTETWASLSPTGRLAKVGHPGGQRAGVFRDTRLPLSPSSLSFLSSCSPTKGSRRRCAPIAHTHLSSLKASLVFGGERQNKGPMETRLKEESSRCEPL